jgi:hypothetical protein
MTDPLERMLAEALTAAGIRFVTDAGGGNPSRLDFRLPDHDIEIEVKRFHSPRIADQMARAENVIALQGEATVRWFCELLTQGR